MLAPNISIIMPVYNAEKYLSRAIDSILAQTLQEWELICIDDGSTDDSAAILEKYVQMDSRIHVIHQENAGVSASRQVGMESASGDYIIHFDSDDWADKEMLKELYSKAEESDADVVICDFYVENLEKETKKREQTFTSLKPWDILHAMFDGKVFGALWHKMIKTSTYKKYTPNFFQGINHCEDLLFWVQLFQHEDVKVIYLPKAYYHYFCNEQSITRNFTRETYNLRLKFYKKLEELLTVPDLQGCKQKAAFSIFHEAIIYDVLTKEEIRTGLERFKKDIVNLESLRWKLGYILLYLGFGKISRKLITY